MLEYGTTRFSFFDFIGYVLPGALCLLLIKWGILLWDVKFWGIADWLALLEINFVKTDSWVFDSLWVVVLSYLAGHIVSFMSSMTVEVFSHKMYLYPSDFLLRRLQDLSKTTKRKGDRDDERKGLSAPGCFNSILVMLIGFALAPMSIHSLWLGRGLRFEYYYLKPLDDIYAWNINYRFKALIRKLEIETGPGVKYTLDEFGNEQIREVYNSDFHRIAYHYEYEKTKQHQNKLDSYIALYDFMRSVTFLSVVLFWLIVIIVWRQSLWCLNVIWFLLIYSFFTYMLFMAFMKFYRKHTLQTFMCLLVDQDLAAVDITKPVATKRKEWMETKAQQNADTAAEDKSEKRKCRVIPAVIAMCLAMRRSMLRRNTEAE